MRYAPERGLFLIAMGMEDKDKQEIAKLLEEEAKKYFPVSRLNFTHIMQTVTAAAIMWIATEFNSLAKKSIQRESEIMALKDQVGELRSDIRYLRNALFEHNKKTVFDENK